MARMTGGGPERHVGQGGGITKDGGGDGRLDSPVQKSVVWNITGTL